MTWQEIVKIICVIIQMICFFSMTVRCFKLLKDNERLIKLNGSLIELNKEINNTWYKHSEELLDENIKLKKQLKEAKQYGFH